MYFKKTTIIFFIHLFCFECYHSAHAQEIKNGRIEKQVNKLTIAIDKRFEMLSVVQYLAESEMAYADETTLYGQRINEYFDPYVAHDIIALYEEMEMNGFDYDAPVQLMLYLDSKFNIVKNIDDTLLIKRASGITKINRFISLLKDFDKKTKFDKFFKENYAILNTTLQLFIDSSLNNFDIIQSIENFYGYGQNSYQIILVPSYGSCNFGPKMPTDKNMCDIYAVVGASETNENDVSFFGNSKFIQQLLWHEFSHSFINPLVDHYYSDFKKYKKLKMPIMADMMYLGYDQWNIILYEHFVRAVVCNLTAIQYNKQEALLQLSNENDNGFVYIDSIYKAIQEQYLNNKTHTRFDDFFPQLIQVIESYTVEFSKTPFIPSINNVVANAENLHFIFPTAEKSDSLNRKIKSYIESINKQFFNLPQQCIIADTTALRTNLADATIICYGSFSGNLWIKNKIKLPISISENTIVAKSNIEQSSLKLISSWHNPDNHDNYMIIYTAQSGEQILNINSIEHGTTNYVIGTSNLEILEKGNYIYKNDNFVIEE